MTDKNPLDYERFAAAPPGRRSGLSKWFNGCLLVVLLVLFLFAGAIFAAQGLGPRQVALGRAMLFVAFVTPLGLLVCWIVRRRAK